MDPGSDVLRARSDVVGSLLRPPELLQARAEFSRSELSAAAFKRVEDAAADEALRMQADAGLEVVTDGEMRRLSFQSQLTEAAVSYTHLRAHETRHDLVCRLLLEKK